MSNTNDFSGVTDGDKLWSIQLGECKIYIIDKRDYPIVCINSDSDEEYYTYNGVACNCKNHENTQSLFWSKPTIIAPEKPKRKVKKTVECWVNVYPNGESMLHNSRRRADANATQDRIACVRCTGEYEVEEQCSI